MSSIGHVLTLVSIVFFFFMLIDSFLESKKAIPFNLGIPRYNKRVLYYQFKINHLQLLNKQAKVLKYNFDYTYKNKLDYELY